jgi:hypothetical protein
VGVRFRKRPVEVEARQLSNVNQATVLRWIRVEGGQAYPGGNGGIIITTREGDMRADVGDWIIQEPFPTDDRRFYPAKSELFMATYEPIGLVPGDF